MRSMSVFAGGVVAVLASAACGQSSPYTIEIRIDPPIIEPGESAMVELRAAFDASSEFAMAALATNLVVEGPVGFASFGLLAPMDSVATQPGEATAMGIETIIARQLQFHSIRADPRNPMPFWSGELAALAGTSSATVDLSTDTGNYQIYVRELDSYSVVRTDQLVEGSATITIVPCRADFNGDGVADLFDFLAFFNAFDAGEAMADFDFDGELTVFDFLAFQNRFGLGC